MLRFHAKSVRYRVAASLNFRRGRVPYLARSLAMQREPPLDSQNLRWSETSDGIPMFATLVWKIELEAQLREAIGAQALAAIARMRRDLPPIAPGQGWPVGPIIPRAR